MDRFGKWALRLCVTVITIFTVNSIIGIYMESSPAQIAEVKRVMWFTLKIGLIGSITFCIGLLAALAFWASRAPKLDDRTKKEVHNATED